MPTIRVSRPIGAPAGQLFALSQDYGLRLAWDPFVKELRFLDGATAAAEGVRVWVKAHNHLSMTVRYLTLRAPERVAMTMVAGPWLFHSFAGTWTFKPLAAGRTAVTFSYHFRTRPRLLRPLLDPAVRWVLRREMQARLRALQRSAETTDILRRLPGG